MLSKCPGSLAHLVLLVLLFLSRSQRNSWCKCRPSCLRCESRSRPLAFQFLLVVTSGVFKVFSRDRVQQRHFLLWNACLSGLWSRSLTFLLVVALGRVLLVLQMRILLFFRTFPHGKSAECRAGGECAAGHVSSSTLSAHQMARACEPTVPSCGVRMHVGDTDQSYYWNRRTRETTWRAPAGFEVVWVGVRSAQGSVWYWNKVTGLTCASAASWVSGCGVRGLASPHSFLGATPLGQFYRENCGP